jgi:hypothetical protein
MLCSEIHKLVFGIRKNCHSSRKKSVIVPIYKKGDKTDCSI